MTELPYTVDELKQIYDTMIEDIYATGNTQLLTGPTAIKLERIEALLKLIDNPHKKFRSIHIGGTSGKGSTSTAVSTFLINAGYKTGLFLSPHIQIINERTQINGYVISTTEMARIWQEIKPLVIKVGEDIPAFGRPSFFEISVALTFQWFAEQNVDVAVIEVGLGGTLDATNVIPAEVAAITSIGLDHTEILGDTVELIAKDKAGIIKKGQKVLTGVQEKHLQTIFADRCKQVGAEDLEIIDFSNIKETDDVFYVRNIELAKAIVKAFDSNISEDVFKSTILYRPPGRLEKMQENPLVLLDGAHNPQKMESLVTAIQKDSEYKDIEWTVVMAIKEHKDSTEMIKILHRLPIKAAIATMFHAQGGFFFAQDPQELAKLLESEKINTVISNQPLEAIDMAIKQGNPVLVTGSLYLLDEVRSYWQAVEELLLKAETGLKGTLTD